MIPMPMDSIAHAIRADRARAGKWRAADASTVVRRVTTDSRDAGPGDLFFAIRGERFDGHDFITEAISRGAAACVAERGHPATVDAKIAAPILAVDDTIAALGRLAAHYRNEMLPASATVVAVTGSNGKTTTKEMIDQVLRSSLKGVASPKSFNNKIGVPLTLFLAEADDRYVIVEIGTNAPGEVAALAAIVSPNAGVITSIGEAHLEGLGDIRAVAAEKASLLRHIRRGGLAVVNIDRREIRQQIAGLSGIRVVTVGTATDAKLHVGEAHSTLYTTTFELEGRFAVELPMPGRHHASNAAATFAVGRWLGLDCEVVIESLRRFNPPAGRTRRLDIGGATVIDDAYNANPASVAAAIDALRCGGSGRRVLVLGDMLELGRDTAGFHEQAVRTALMAGLEVVIAVGPRTSEAALIMASTFGDTQVRTCGDGEAAISVLDEIVAPGDTVWIKGSRAMQLDRLVDHLAVRNDTRASLA